MAYGTTLQRLAYYYLPGPAKDLMASVYGRHQRRERYGPLYRTHLDFLQESQWWPQEKLLGYQAERVEAFLQKALAEVAFYRGREAYHGWRPGSGVSGLPLLTKRTVRDRMADLYSPGSGQVRWSRRAR